MGNYWRRKSVFFFFYEFLSFTGMNAPTSSFIYIGICSASTIFFLPLMHREYKYHLSSAILSSSMLILCFSFSICQLSRQPTCHILKKSSTLLMQIKSFIHFTITSLPHYWASERLQESPFRSLSTMTKALKTHTRSNSCTQPSHLLLSFSCLTCLRTSPKVMRWFLFSLFPIFFILHFFLFFFLFYFCGLCGLLCFHVLANAVIYYLFVEFAWYLWNQWFAPLCCLRNSKTDINLVICFQKTVMLAYRAKNTGDRD